MSEPRGEPSRDELQAMAYADGELAGEERASFEARLAAEPLLGAEVARYRALDVLARRAAPLEPMDFEWRRVRRDPLQRAALLLGWSLFALGAGGILAWSAFELVRSALPLAGKAAIFAAAVGLALLALAALRARRRTRRFDPYAEIQR